MKKYLRIAMPLVIAVCMLLASISTNAASYQSIKKAPQFRYGIDVSEWNGDLDWAHLRKSGVEFAYIRIGCYHSGYGYTDERFKQNVKACVENGIDFGVYVYSYVYRHSDTEKCAKWIDTTLKSLGKYTKDKDTIPVAYDIEDEIHTNALVHGTVSASYMHNGVQKFCNKIKSYGYIPVVYSFSSFFNDFLDVNKLQSKGAKIWYANWPYHPDTSIKKQLNNGTYVDCWQFSSSHTINGALGLFDINVCYEDFYDYSNEDSKLKIEGLKTSYAYKKAGVKPKFKLYSGKTLLKKGTDYKVFYFDNNKTGRARMRIVRYKNGKFFEYKTFTFIVRPVAVKNLKAEPDVDEITLTWEKQNGAKGYQIYEYDDDDKEYKQIDTVKSNHYTDYFLDEAKTYKLRVRAETVIDDKTVYSNFADITCSTKYKAVKLNSVEAKSRTKAAVKWTPKTENTKGYIIEYSVYKDFSDKQTLKVKGKDMDSAIINSGINLNYRYYFRVRSYNSVKGKVFYSMYSKTISAVI